MASWRVDKRSLAHSKSGIAEPPLSVVGGLTIGRMLHSAFALIILLEISFCMYAFVFMLMQLHREE